MSRALNQLSNMNARSACPKCDGYGYIHDTADKHDKPDRRTRCKKCRDCSVCSGSGVVVGKSACRTCKARGFVHPPNGDRHNANEFIKCSSCYDCKDCIGGIPRNIAKNLPQAAPVFTENPLDLPANLAVVRLDDNGMLPAPRQRTTLTGSSPFFDTLFASDSAHYQQNRKNLQSRHVSAQQTLIQFEAEEAFTEAVKPTVPCPRCSGKGWKHESAAKHERGLNVRCKQCINCKACSGKGKVDADKVPCSDCNLAGFFHPAAEDDLLRPHDAPPTLRCFYCQVCATCNGHGITSLEKEKPPARQSAPPPAPPPLINPALMPLGGLGLPVPGGMNPMGGFPMPIVKPQAPSSSNQAPPNIPAPPMLSVVMMRSPDNPDMQVPMVDLPGIGLVPAEQILKMQVPMVVMPNIAPNMMPADSGNDRDEGDAQSHAESDGISETEKDEVLRNVWG
ncbi:hypothetical protein BJ741DRAFT_422802 [Chytriomyces cf. hyalinus JEL632]|nr:hypothetical protein BJ741DRAFT_422802 [Chytriomyces cf. hyalinus JEL632]